ncbi:MAG: RNA methyltransferase [Aquificota bacterium]|nr:MAG: RNA methyltransferase [Aquificota bacterium]
MKVRVITSPQNPRIKDIVRLRERRYREKKGLFLVEGFKEISMALEGGVELDSLFFCKGFFRGGEGGLLASVEAQGGKLFSLPPRLFEKVSYRENPDGLLAVARQFHRGLDDLVLGASPLLVVTESLEKPGNLGAILRCVDAIGADGLIVCDPVVDLFNPNVVRASRGTLFTVKVAASSPRETIKWLKDKGIEAVITTPHAPLEYTEVDYRRPTAVVVGSESKGLTPLWTEGFSLKVKIPMLGRADSLNVAVAAAVVLYEALRQRREGSD